MKRRAKSLPRQVFGFVQVKMLEDPYPITSKDDDEEDVVEDMDFVVVETPKKPPPRNLDEEVSLIKKQKPPKKPLPVKTVPPVRPVPMLPKVYTQTKLATLPLETELETEKVAETLIITKESYDEQRKNSPLLFKGFKFNVDELHIDRPEPELASWVQKYEPTESKTFVGNQGQIGKALKWLREHESRKAGTKLGLLITGYNISNNKE